MTLLNYSTVKCSLHSAGVQVQSMHWFSGVKVLSVAVLWCIMAYYREDVGQRSKGNMTVKTLNHCFVIAPLNNVTYKNRKSSLN